MRNAILILAAVLLAVPLGAATPNNDDTCDISTLPAATLLLPYFAVDIVSPPEKARTTIFTVVNTTRVPQIARVTLWTDWSLPLLSFDLFLTGYDVQAINLYDVITRGAIAPPAGTSNRSAPGPRSADVNPKFAAAANASCGNLPSTLPIPLLTDLQTSFTTGIYSPCGSRRVGGTHTNAIGFATIDVVSNCSSKSPHDADYFDELLFDNVLTGDYEHILPDPAFGNHASGSPLVHIRAIPEGGPAGEVAATALPYTFYDRVTPSATRRIDRRQPLNSAFVGRYIQGGASGFETEFQLWREAMTGPAAACSTYIENRSIPVARAVRFDERENPTTTAAPPNIPIFVPSPFVTSSAMNLSSFNSFFPPLTSGDVAGWIWMDLNNAGSESYSAEAGRDFRTNTSTRVGSRQSQNWVSVHMFAEGRYSVLMDATAFANGCSPAPPPDFNAVLGPGANVTP
jgi:hypothetical protein